MSLRILIVEDEPIVAMHLETILSDAGHVVVGVAISMQSALAMAGKCALDVAIMDVDLAGAADGVETALRLRREHDLPSLFVGVRVDDRFRERAAACQPLGFVAKPFLEADVVRPLQDLMATSAN